ncbi:MAG: TolC family outer membrane protein [Maricaulaceae bacterium]
MWLRKVRTYPLLSLAMLMILNSHASADSLKDALASAYSNSPRLQAERARLRETDETYIQARSQSRPTITLAGTAAGSAVRTPQFSFLGPVEEQTETITGTPVQAQLEILQPIYQGGRLRAQRQQALSSILAARENLRSAEQNALLEAATAYADVIRDEAITRIRRNDVRVLARQREAAQITFDVGQGTRTDMAQADSRLAASNIGLASADAQLEVSRAAFRRAIGRAPVDLQPIPSVVIPNSVEEAIGVSLEKNPDLRAAYHNRSAIGRNIDIARSSTKPSVSLSATAASQREQILGFGQADAFTITAQVSVPLFSAGFNQSRIRQATEVKTRLGYEIEQAELEIIEAVTQLWAQFSAAQSILISSDVQVEAAKLAFEGVTLEQEVGTRTMLDVLDAEQEVLNAEINHLNAQRDLDVAIFQMLTMMGTFTAESLSLTIDAYDPGKNLEIVRSDKLHRLGQRVLPSFVSDDIFEEHEGTSP